MRGFEALGTGDRDLHAHGQAARDERIRHIVAVAHIAELQAFERALVFAHGHQVGEHLAGVRIVGKPVDDGNGAELGEIFHFLLLVSADHDAVQITRKYARGILYRLASSYLKIVTAQKQGAAAQLIHAHFKGHSRARGRLLEYHSQRLTLQICMRYPVLAIVFELICEIEDARDILGGKIGHF